MGEQAALVLCVVGVEEGAEVLAERRLQFGVTHADVQRVGVIGDLKQVRHARLRGPAVVAYLEVGHVVELVAKVEGRGEVHHVAGDVVVFLAHVFVVQHRMLWQDFHTCAQVVLVADDAQHNSGCVVEVLIFGELAQRVVVKLLMTQAHQFVHSTCNIISVGLQGVHQVAVSQVVVGVGSTVALVVAVVEAIAELEVGALGDWLAVSGLNRVVATAAWGVVIAVVDVVVHAGACSVVDARGGELGALAVGEAASHAEGDVAPFIVQLAVDLKFTVHAFVVAVGLLAAVAGVHDGLYDIVNFGITHFGAVSECLLGFIQFLLVIFGWVRVISS